MLVSLRNVVDVSLVRHSIFQMCACVRGPTILAGGRGDVKHALCPGRTTTHHARADPTPRRTPMHTLTLCIPRQQIDFL